MSAAADVAARGKGAISANANANAVRDTLLAELRCELILSKIASLEIERVGVALRNNLISVPQAIALLDADNTLDCFKFGGGSDHA